MEEVPIIAGRSCNACTLCCKVLSITAIAKPQGQWCVHCEVGRDCKIYETRPEECRSFYCGFLTWSTMEEHWFPARSKMVVVSELEGNRIAIHVDQGRPSAWRQEPYYSEIKHWAAVAIRQKLQVVVCIGKRAIVIFPDREVDLGIIDDDERILTRETASTTGVRLDALKLKADDPRIAGMQPGKPFQTRGR